MLRRSKLLRNVSCHWVPQITFYFRPFWPIWPILAWADRPDYTYLSGLREERKKYSIGKLGYTSVSVESKTQRHLKWHGPGITSEKSTLPITSKSGRFTGIPPLGHLQYNIMDNISPMTQCNESLQSKIIGVTPSGGENNYKNFQLF